jgi:hypothetical protein
MYLPSGVRNNPVFLATEFGSLAGVVMVPPGLSIIVAIARETY